MAEKKLAELEAEAREPWPLVECTIVHRLGAVPLGEASVAIVVSTPHRARGLRSRRVADRYAQSDVPIWKREHWADGSTEWVHPGLEQDSEIRRQGDNEKC